MEDMLWCLTVHNHSRQAGGLALILPKRTSLGRISSQQTPLKSYLHPQVFSQPLAIHGSGTAQARCPFYLYFVILSGFLALGPPETV